MAKTSSVEKNNRRRKLKMSRVALRDLGNNGLIPGLVKSSW